MASSLHIDNLKERTTANSIVLHHNIRNSSGLVLVNVNGDDTATFNASFIGSIAAFGTDVVPAGWLECDGSAISQSTYSSLYGVIGTKWVTAWASGQSITANQYRKNTAGAVYQAVGSGTTSGSTLESDSGVSWNSVSVFEVPDLRGEFLRGWDNTRGVDSSRTFASAQSDEFKSHTHNTGSIGYGGGSTTANHFYAGSGTGGGAVTVTSAGGAETRPRNISVMYCIKH